MILGEFSYDPAGDTYTGDVHTLAFPKARLFLRPNTKVSQKEPDYRVALDAAFGPEIGAAWKRQSEGGKPFVSVLIDDPSLPQPINAAMFMSEHENSARLVWTRSKKETPEAKPAEERRPRRAPRARPAGP